MRMEIDFGRNLLEPLVKFHYKVYIEVKHLSKNRMVSHKNIGTFFENWAYIFFKNLNMYFSRRTYRNGCKHRKCF